ncbi:hypothetical protein OJ998_30095 [Solirubrobacter taibaiensis]|nr:hypothetical protein [Solirubrobacter taibaiensis]
MSVNPVIFDLGAYGSVLATRDKGRVAGRAAADQLSSASSMVLAFWGVEVASPPFLDEVVRAVRAELLGGTSSRLLIVAGVNADVRESLEIVLERQGAAMAALEHGQLTLLGGSRHLEETLREAQKLGYFSARDLAERLAVKLPNLHSRLKALAEAGAVARDHDAPGERPKRGGTAKAFRTGDLEVLDRIVTAS